ncbi:MAG: formate--tetrahydrofolate ligase [Planctomycetes bacterium]|nr:formate--tetrahydrofolate ligase [Planctomycetota bacterium]
MTAVSPAFTPRPIADVAAELGLGEQEIVPYGRDIAKLDFPVLDRPWEGARRGRLILVSAITPTPAGEGKTTTVIGLGQALRRLGQKVCVTLREPSLGPCMGKKGGGTGAGRSQLLPPNRINLHFTGDLHAVTAAHNLLAAMIDNHLYHGNALHLDPRRVLWRRVIDLNDRSLRAVVIGLGGVLEGIPRETGFDITAASEVMATLCLAGDLEDLRARLDRTLVGFTHGGDPVTAKQLKASGAMLVLLREAFQPNLVQTCEGVPALVHGGPFANIAHGCNSVVATRTALRLADWVVTEAGFGFDLGAEKFFDIKCVQAGLDTAAVVLVATVRALKMHGGVGLADLGRPDPAAVQRGLGNLHKHVENIRHFGEAPIVALNRFKTDTADEIAVVERSVEGLGVPFAVTDHFARGGAGAEELARVVMAHADGEPAPFHPLYDWSAPVEEKILTVARKMYGARDVTYTKTAQADLREIQRLGYAGLPVCIAKTQSSLSDDPNLPGRPRDFVVTVRHLQINAGAGFLVVLTGDIMRMPGLPKKPLAESLDLVDRQIVGLY